MDLIDRITALSSKVEKLLLHLETEEATKNALILLVLMVLAGCAGPQKTAGINDEAAPIKTDRIVAHVDGTPDEAYRHMASFLQRRGYAISHSDAELRSLVTEYRTFRGSIAARMNTYVEAEPSRVVLRGDCRVLGSDMPIVKQGQSGSIMRRCWAELYEVAEAVGDSLAY